MQVSIYEAKTGFSRLIDAVEAGQEVVIARHNKPVARIVAVTRTPRRRIGALAGRPFRMGKSFDSSRQSEALADAFGIPRK